MADIDLRETIKLLTDLAPGMREAGIKRAQFGDVIVDLEPHFEETPLPAEGPTEGKNISPFEDENTYGEGGGYVPGFSRLRDRTEQ